MIINPAQQVHGLEEIEAGEKALRSGHWAEGNYARQFRESLLAYLHKKYITLTNSGSSANLAAILALTTKFIPEHRRLLPDDEVITPALCFPTTVSPIIYSGAVPVFVDVEPGTWNIDPTQVVEQITPRTKAIVVAHNLGNLFNVGVIRKIAVENNLWLIEDACDAMGGKWNGEMAGSLGHIGTFSFYPAHHISTGEGGAACTDNVYLHKGMRSIANWGRHCWCEPAQDDSCGRRYEWQLGGLPKGYDHKNTYSEWGFNLKMTDIQAAIGDQQMLRLEGFVQARKANHARIREFFSQYEDWFELPEIYPGADPSWFGYVIKLKDSTPFNRDEMAIFLEQHHINSRAFFCGNITLQPVVYDNPALKYRTSGDLSVSDDIMRNAFWIGCHPAIGKNEMGYLLEVLNKFLGRY